MIPVRRNKHPQRRSATALLALFLFAELFGLFALARPARAQWQVTDPGAIAQRQAFRTGEQVEVSVGNMLLATALSAVVQAMQYFFTKLAYDAALHLATEGVGQKSLVYETDFEDYMGEVVGGAVGTAIGEFGEAWGVNLCQIPNINLHIYITISLHELYPEASRGPQPTCRWQDIRNNWEDIDEVLENTDLSPEEFFSANLDTTASDFGIALSGIAEVDQIVGRGREANILDRLEGEGFRAARDLISGNILQPGQLVREEATALTAKHQGELTSQQISGIYGAEALQVFPMAISVFVNTFVSEFISKGFEELFGDDAQGPGGTAASDATYFFGAAANRNLERAQSAFGALSTAVPRKELNVYDIVSEFAACPEVPGLNNCVIDSKFDAAIRRAQIGAPLTIRKAMDQGFLNANKPLISPRREQDNTDRNCYLTGYCYSNIQKLRKVRILPLGFEIAAFKADPDLPQLWTLGNVVNGFYDCVQDRDARGNPIGEPYADAAHPFCHLINPDWLLKAPEAWCEATVVGPQLASPVSSIRKEECVDVSTCIAEDEDGNCIDNNFSYCTKEKNIWRIPGDDCPAQFNTCTTYTDSQGNALSALSRTVDYGACSLESVGCRAYSTEQGNGAWLSSVSAAITPAYKAAGRNQPLYFNQTVVDQSQVCGAATNGCSAFENPFTGAAINLKKAPAYLGCYDRNRGTPETEWPRTEAELASVSENPACDAYAGVCVESEVGCEGYTPVLGGLKVPAVVGFGNFCSPACVGYDVFKQLESEFEPARDPLYFIPADADVCRVEYAGCSEFTNIDELAKGGEGIEYYTNIKYCEKPEGEDRLNEKAFYTWEGTIREGFVLRVHQLKFVNALEANHITSLFPGESPADQSTLVYELRAGSPSYADRDSTDLRENFAVCNKTNYFAMMNSTSTPIGFESASPDCREFYDSEGQAYYRLLARTVTVSDACHPLRKTETFLTDSDLNAEQCAFAGGLSDVDASGAPICRLCRGGGRYQDGACVYQAITMESNICPAQANNCREFAGNFAGNIETVASYDFEPEAGADDPVAAAKEGWTGGTIVAEAVHVGGHSLEVAGDIGLEAAPGTLISSQTNPDIVYELSFWARGAAQNLVIAFKQPDATGAEVGDFTSDPITATPSRVSIGGTWREYRLGPVSFTGSETVSTMLTFVRSPGGAGPYYLDNVKLTRSESARTLIKDSWKRTVEYPPGFGVETEADVPLLCDSNPTDVLPGEALGCRAYRAETTGQIVDATGFEKLCRPEAIGCQPLVDTYNTREETATAYNVRCPTASPTGRATEPEECTMQLPAVFDVRVLPGSCVIQPGSDACYVEKIVLPELFNDPLELARLVALTSFVDASTVLIPADTSPTQPIFLANRPAFQCEDRFVGCQELGLEDRPVPGAAPSAFAHTDAFILNNPSLYEDTLCRADLAGCEEYRSGGAITYFKNPALTGNSFCVYREAITDASGVAKSGWFREGIGACQGTGNACRSDTDCGTGPKCQSIGSVACYPSFLEVGGRYGIWSNANENYEGFVGRCDAQWNGCTELIDPGDTSDIHPAGEPYDVIFDNNVTRRIGECEGQVSLRDGCVLFDRTNDPNKLYNSAATYLASEQAARAAGAGDPKGAFVSPSTTGRLDSNIILRVDQDRQCSEWLACQSSEIKKDEITGQVTRLCSKYEACRGTSAGASCEDWVDDLETQDLFITPDEYVRRGVSWSDEEYSGYSLFNKFQIQSADVLSFDLGEFDDLEEQFSGQKFLGYVADARFFRGADNVAFGCLGKADWNACGFENGGRCNRNSCVYPIDGVFPPLPAGYNSDDAAQKKTNIRTVLAKLIGGSCKAFPEESSPFPGSAARASRPIPADGDADILDGLVNGFSRRTAFTELVPSLRGANLCQDVNGEPADCSCSYEKVTYGNGTVDYWPSPLPKDVKIPNGICVGGVEDGEPCSEDEQCNDDPNANAAQNPARCVEQSTKETDLGFTGFCLERDLSRPLFSGADQFACLTWLPVQTSASGIDLFNSDPKTGYAPLEDALDADGNYFGQVYCANSTHIGSGEYDSLLFTPNVFEDSNEIDDGTWSYSATEAGVDAAYNDIRSIQYSICTTGGLGTSRIGIPLAIAQCDGGFFNTEGTYTLLQLWGWGFGEGVTPNRVVLRFDNYIPGAADGQGYVGGNRISFAPDTDDTGTTVHPARWSNEQTPTSWFSPGPSKKPAGYDVDESYIWRAPIEGQIREQELSKVYFVPLAYTDVNNSGALDRNPGLLTSGIVIDFDALGDQAFVVNSLEVPRTDDNQSDTYNDIRATFEIFADANARSYAYRVNNPAEFNSGTDREHVARRYVTLFESSGRVFSSIATPEAVSPNPFVDAAPCGASTEQWFAVGMDFNADGEFLGYISRWCHGTAGGSNGVKLGVVAELKTDHCTEFVQVYNENPVGGPVRGTTNKAWTDRVWQSSSFLHPYESYLQRTQPKPPFGSLPIAGNSIARLPLRDPVTSPGLQSSATNPSGYQELRKNAIFAGDGVPYACQESWNRGITAEGSFLGAPCDLLKTNGYDSALADVLSGKFQSDSRDALARLFALSFHIGYLYHPQEVFGGDELVGQTDGSDASGGASGAFVGLLPPQIFAVNPVTCGSVEGVGTCTAGDKDNISVSRRNGILKDYNGDGRVNENDGADDGNGDGKVDAIVQVGAYGARLSFFAFADHNRMPIRSVMIDWGDDPSGLPQNFDTIGMYKNKKPYCGGVDASGVSECQEGTTLTGLTCASDQECKTVYGDTAICANRPIQATEPLFGNAARACVDQPFEFEHTYGCGAELDTNGRRVSDFETGNSDAYIRLLALGLRPTDPVCVFKPRVQVKDNWGWCNGSCNVAGNTGCYDNVADPFGGETDQCDPEEAEENGLVPWTEYKGEIIVVPR